MLRKIRRQMSKALTGSNQSEKSKSVLKLEALESRTLLNVDGYWSELGYRSGSGGGVSCDLSGSVGQSKLVTTTDGDAVVFWVEGSFGNANTLDVSDTPVQGTYTFSGSIYARQYAGADLGWWDMTYGSGDTAITNGGQIDAVAGPNGSMVLVGVDGSSQAFVMLWDGDSWENITTVNADTEYSTTVNPVIAQVQDTDEEPPAEGEDPVVVELVAEVSSPSVAVNDAGEIFVSYTVVHPNSNQYEIVVMQYGYTYDSNDLVGPSQNSDRGWKELTSTEVGLIGSTSSQQTGGVSNSSGQSYDSSIAVDNFGHPVVVWTEAYRSKSAEIYAKRWDGNSWEEIGENSASINPVNDDSGISSNSYQDIQPDVAVNDDGDIIVSWVCWHKWSQYQTDGEAGVYVKYLPGDDLDGAWRGYNFKADGVNVSSDSGPGIAQGNNVPDGRAGLGWYYDPEIVLDSSGSPAIKWFGWGEDENRAVNRDGENNVTDDPFWGTFVSYYYDHDSSSATANTFEMLFEDYDESSITWRARSNSANTSVQRVVATDPDMLTWGSSILFTGTGASEKIIISYVQGSDTYTGYDHDNEVFVRYWNSDDEAWQTYGLGSDSNGNPIISNYPQILSDSDPDIEYFEFNSSSTDDYDVVMAIPSEDGVNEGRMYIYNRYEGTWGTTTPTAAGGEFNSIDADGDGTKGFGRIYDLDGQPEIEYDDITNGTPILAFLDDVTGLPYVYKYTISNGWLPVGSTGGVQGKAGLTAGNITSSENVGIDAQIGPDGAILVAYVATNNNGTGPTTDDYDQVITRLFDPNTNTWGDAGEGTLVADAIQEVTYFSDYNGFDFDAVGELDDGQYTTGRNPERVYEDGKWKYWESSNEDDDAVEGNITSYADDDLSFAQQTDRLHVWTDPDDNGDNPERQGAMEIAFSIAAPTAEAPARNLISAEVDYQFDMMASAADIIIEFDASLDAMGNIESGAMVDPMQNMDLYLYLTVDGQVVDTNPNDNRITAGYFPVGEDITPVAVCKAGELIAMTQFKFDSSELRYRNGSLVELTSLNNRVGFVAYASTNGGAAVDVEQNGAVRIDNVAIYQKIISESRFVSGNIDGNTDTFDNTTLAATGWTTSGSVNGTLSTGVGQTGQEEDDALQISYSTSSNQTGVFSKTYNPREYGYVRLDFDYRLVTDDDFGVNDQLKLVVSTTGGGTLATYTVTGAEADSEWTRVSLIAPVSETSTTVVFASSIINGDGSAVGTADVYIDNVDISSSLSLDLAGDIDLANDDPEFNDPTASKWVWESTSPANITASYDNNAGSNADGAVKMTFPGGMDETDYGQLAYGFSTGISTNSSYYSYMSLDFSYKIVLDAAGAAVATANDGDVNLGDYGQVMVYLVEDSGDGVLSNDDYYTQISGEASYRQYSDGYTDGNSGWVDVTDLNLGLLNEGTDYFIVFRGWLSASDNDHAGPGNDSYIYIDDVSPKYTGYSTWSSYETNASDIRNDNGQNNYVGIANNAGVYPYNFRGNMHSSIIYYGGAPIQSQMLTVPDFEQRYTGDAIVSFRYRHSDGYSSGANLPDLEDIRVLVDGVEYDYEDLADQFGGTDLDYDSDSSWCNGVTNGVEYTQFTITIPDLESGTHDISLELMGSSDLWIDNLVIQGSQSRTNTVLPIVKLGAIGQEGVRPFIVSGTYATVDIGLYREGALDNVYAKYQIDSNSAGTVFSETAFYHSALYELNDNEWDKYGSSMSATGSINLLGVPGPGITVPLATLYSIVDFCVGKDQLEWILVARATTDPVDTDDADSEINYYTLHPFTGQYPAYYGPQTELDLQLRRWDISDPNDTDRQGWTTVDIPLPVDDFHAFYKGQLYSCPDQSIVIGFSGLTDGGEITTSSSQVYKLVNGTWEGFGTSTDNGNVQNSDLWTANYFTTMTSDGSGNPIVIYVGYHLDCYCIREFVPTLDDSDAVITIANGTNNWMLDYGQVADGVVVSRQVTITNNGMGDLLVQNISFGGLDAIAEGFTITNGTNIGTASSAIVSGNRTTYNIQFDRSKVTNLVPGTYEGVVVIQTNEGDSDTHLTDGFQEIGIRVVITSGSDIVIDDDYFQFDDKIITTDYDPDDHDDDNSVTVNNPYQWETKVVYVRNSGTEDLSVNSLVYSGAGFAIKSIKRNGSSALADNLDTNDDGLLDATEVLAPGEYMAVEVAFIPQEPGLYDETLYVCSNDTDESVVPIRLVGYGLNGGDVEVEVSVDGVDWTTVWRSNDAGGLPDVDEVLDLGSTVWDTSDATPLKVRVINSGSTTLTIDTIRMQRNNSPVAMLPSSVMDLEIEPNDSYTFELTYTPLTDGVDTDTEIGYLLESLFIITDAVDDPEISLTVEGYAVPEAPVIQVVEAETGDIVGGWDPERGWITDGLLNLGTDNIGSSSFSKTVYIRNIGGVPMTIDGMTVGNAGNSTSDYVITPNNPVGSDGYDKVLDMDDPDYAVVITMTPSSAGEKKPMFMIDYNWIDVEGQARERLSYTGLYAKVTDQSIALSDDDGITSNTVMDFQKVGVGGTGEGNIIITNQGNSNLIIYGWSLYDGGQLVVDTDLNDDWILNDDAAFGAVAFETTFTIRGGASFTLPVIFSPDDDGGTLYSGTIRIYSDDSTQTDNGDGRYYTDYTLSGEGVDAGVVNTSITSFDLGDVNYREHWKDNSGNQRKIITLTNNSDVDISIANIYSSSSMFAVWTDVDGDGIYTSGRITDGDIVLAPDESINVAVSFYASQAFFDTSSLAVANKPKLVVEYDNYAGDDIDSTIATSVYFDATVVMSGSSSVKSNKVVWSDADGKLVTITLAGPGSVSVTAVSSGNNNIGAIVLTGTTAKSTLKIVGENGASSLVGAIVGENGQAITEIGNIIMQNVSLDGTISSGYDHDINIGSIRGKLVLGDVTGASDIYIATPSVAGLTITTGSIAAGTDIYVGGNVKSFVVDSKINVDAGMQADSLTVAGNLRSLTVKDIGTVVTNIDVTGDITSLNLGRSGTYSGTLINGGSLGTFNLTAGTLSGTIISDNLNKLVAYSLNNAIIAVQDTIRSIAVKNNMIESLILAGVTPGTDNIIGNANDTLIGGSQINKITVAGIVTDSSILSGVGVNSVAAGSNYNVFGSVAEQPLSSVSGTIGTVKFGGISIGNGTTEEYGIGAGTSIGKLIIGKTAYTAPSSWNLDQIAGDDFYLRVF